jgi:alpha-methylacyl-CoA racemase
VTGPLKSLKVVEFAGLGPAPLAGQLLADQGADVIVIDRNSAPADPFDINHRGKRSIALDLKSAGGLDAIKAILASADVLIEGFRPGVMERMGLGPDDLRDPFPRLIYGRITGWGQTGPLAQSAGHDLTYLALSGALHAMGKTDEPPEPPLNLVADYGAGSMFLIFGILSAVFERQSSGRGQVVDAAMMDGVPAIMGLIHSQLASGNWTPDRQANMLDGGAPYYRCYKTRDGKFIAVGPIEPHFFAEMVRLAGLSPDELAIQNDRRQWPETRERFADHFATKTRGEWAAIFEGSDACVSPVLSFDEVEQHPQNIARGVFYRDAGAMQAAPAPRLDRTPAEEPNGPTGKGANAEQILTEAGFSSEKIAALLGSGAIR